MSQTAVNDEPVQAYEGKVQSGGTSQNIASYLASGQIFFGKAVSLASVTTQLEVGGASGGPQQVILPTSEALIAAITAGGGIAIADPSVERTRVTGGGSNSAPFGEYQDETSVPVMRKGQIWVLTEIAVTDLSLGVFVRFQVPGGTPPADSLGSFTSVNTANHGPVPAGTMSWRGTAVIGSSNFALLDINLP